MAATYDIVVGGRGTCGCFAAATAAGEGEDVALLERTPEAATGRSAHSDDGFERDRHPQDVAMARGRSGFGTGRSGGSTRRGRRAQSSVRMPLVPRTLQFSTRVHA